MTIYRFEDHGLSEVAPTTFWALDLKERQDVQRVLRASIGAITPGVETMVLAEEFGDWDESRRRIDLLCLDADSNLVVVELKRTETGGHMELQALRYAAMVSAMRFEQAVEAHRNYRRSLGLPEEEAEQAIRAFLGIEDGLVAFSDKVRIVLAAADFSRELTTSVLWLNTQGRLDIRCVQMRPIPLDGHVLLDIQQVIPLPQAAAYQVAVREKTIEQEVASSDGRDFTRYDLTIGGSTLSNLAKRRFIYAVVAEALRQGLKPDEICELIPWRKNQLFVRGGSTATGSEIVMAVGRDPRRYFSEDDEVFRIDGSSCVLIKHWGHRTEEAVKNLLAALPHRDLVSYRIAS